MHFEDPTLTTALQRYLRWMRTAQRTVVIRGVSADHTSVASYDLVDTYVPLAVEARTGYNGRPALARYARIEVDQDAIDFTPLAPGGGTGSTHVPDPTVITNAERIMSLSPTVVLSGEPGSGKTTVLQYVAAVLANSHLEDIPEEAESKLGLRQEVPIPVYLPLGGYSAYLEASGAPPFGATVTLLSYAEQYAERRQSYLDLPEHFFARLLQAGIPIALLLDGLDEVADEDRRIEVSRAIQDTAQTPYGCSIVVSSRPSAYRGDAILPPYFSEYRLLPMTGERVEVLVERVCDNLRGPANSKSIVDADVLKQAVRSLDGPDSGDSMQGRRVVDSPLMVRILITLHMVGQQISDNRAELFAQYIESLIAGTYNPDVAVAREISRSAGPSALQRSLLAHLAFEIYRGAADVHSGMPAEELRSFAISHISSSLPSAAAVEAADRFVDSTRQRGGVITYEYGLFRFTHLAIQEFLVARYLAESLRSTAQIVEFIEAEGASRIAWWREPLVLCVGYLSISSPDTARELVAAAAHLKSAPPGDSTLELIELDAALAACGNWPAGTPLSSDVAQHVATRLFTDEIGYDNPVLRAVVGTRLGRLGDPRPVASSQVPEVVRIPRGRFLMGNPAETVVNLPSMRTGAYELASDGFLIARYPVVNFQFQFFITDGGYGDTGRRYWSAAGLDWKDLNDITSPAYWGDPTWNIPNLPVVGVSWYEAVAFCNWLSVNTGQRWALPSEKEWEYSARGVDARSWPWGNEEHKDAANTLETGLHSISPVGLFDRYSSVFGVCECAGNVWEWSSSEFRGYAPYRDDEGRETPDGVMPRVIRGGSWLNALVYASCANRDHYAPGDRHFDLGFRVKLVIDEQELCTSTITLRLRLTHGSPSTWRLPGANCTRILVVSFIRSARRRMPLSRPPGIGC